MTRSTLKTLLPLLLLVLCLTVGGVYANWQYLEDVGQAEVSIPNTTKEFKYGLLYITDVEVSGGSYASADARRAGDLNLHADLQLRTVATSTVVVTVTLYNSTDVSYYYNKTETISSSNTGITYEVSGIVQKDEIAPKSYHTLTVTFSYKNGTVASSAALLADLHFNFVVDKDSIGTIVAQTAVDRFRDILNNVVAPDSYQTLENAMNNRGGLNKASAVTYIGNVEGSTNSDSQVIASLFGNEFMSMDLDGDGKAEPITMMIKRENLDDNAATGDEYSYTSWGRTYTVNGVEMTLYITSEDLGNVSSNEAVVVYAATFTKLEGADQWTILVPLTKGTASANNYSGWGDANSFNTDTWKSDGDKTMATLVSENLS